MHCRRCKNKVSQYAKMCPYCHARIKHNERATRQYIEMLIDDKITHKNEGSKSGRRMGITLLSAFFAVYILLISYKERVNEWKITDQTVFYMKEDSLVAKNLKTGDKKKVLELSEERAEDAVIEKVEEQTFHHDERRSKLYYARNIMAGEDGNNYDIVERDVYDWSHSTRTIADHVRLHLWDGFGALYFAKRDSEFLYCFDREGIVPIKLPLVKEMHEVKGTRKLFVIAYEPRNDSNRYDYDSYDKTDSVIFYLLDSNTGTVEKLFHNRIDGYGYTADCKYLYYLLDNQLYEYNLILKKARIFEKNVYQFMVVHTEGRDKLYYISYELKSLCLYDFVQDPFKKADVRTASNKAMLSKESSRSLEERLSREQFRKQLHNEKIYMFEGTLYAYQENKKVMVGKDVSALDKSYCCMLDHEPYVYKSKPIMLGDYKIKKEGVEDINSVYDMIVNIVDGEMCNYDVTSEPLYKYRTDKNIREKCDALMSMDTAQYKVGEGKVRKYMEEACDEDEMHECCIPCGNKTYYISLNDGYTLYEEQDGKKEVVARYVESYQLLRDGRIIVLCYDEAEGKDVLYCVYPDLHKIEVDTHVVGILGRNIVSSKK